MEQHYNNKSPQASADLATINTKQIMAHVWLTYVLALLLATGCSLILAAPTGQPQAVPPAGGQTAGHLSPGGGQQSGTPQWAPMGYNGNRGQAVVSNQYWNYDNKVSSVSGQKSKNVQYFNQGQAVTPMNGNSNALVSSEGSFGHNSTPSSEQVQPKVKATPEQKELKRKLLELAEKATASPDAGSDGSLLRFNTLTKEFEPITVDPNFKKYKQKLQDALKALSAKKLPADKLRQALEDVADEADEADGADGAGQTDDVDWLAKMPQPAQEETHLFGVHKEEAPSHEGDSLEAGHDNQEAWHDEGEKHAEPSDGDQQQDLAHDEQPTSAASTEEHSPDDGPTQEERSHEPGPTPEEYADESLFLQLREELDDRLNRVSDLLYFRPEFLNQLLHLDEERLNPLERQFKRMVLCNSDEQFCDTDPHRDEPHQDDSQTESELEFEQDNEPEQVHEFEQPAELQDEQQASHNYGPPYEGHYEPPYGRQYQAPYEHQYQGPSNYYNGYEETGAHYAPAMPVFVSSSPKANHFSRSSSSVYYAQNHHHESAHSGPDELVAVAGSGPVGGAVHAVSAAAGPRSGILGPQSHGGAQSMAYASFQPARNGPSVGGWDSRPAAKPGRSAATVPAAATKTGTAAGATMSSAASTTAAAAPAAAATKS